MCGPPVGPADHSWEQLFSPVGNLLAFTVPFLGRDDTLGDHARVFCRISSSDR
jgi:hypothetical protein